LALSKIEDGRQPLFLKFLNRHIFATV